MLELLQPFWHLEVSQPVNEETMCFLPNSKTLPWELPTSSQVPSKGRPYLANLQPLTTALHHG